MTIAVPFQAEESPEKKTDIELHWSVLSFLTLGENVLRFNLGLLLRAQPEKILCQLTSIYRSMVQVY